jgi:structural maintenance of chromosomes protein 5
VFLIDDAEVFPGPRLNIILGPNGTGKSTLTHAICLACAGVPSSVGRSDDLRHFIKRGKEQAGCFCEVDLLLKNDTVVTVRRTLNSETKGSKWHLNNKATTQKDIKELMGSLHIDVDNLCTFMPQDRVSQFTQMNPKKLLQSTLECIKTDDGEISISSVKFCFVMFIILN